MPSGNRDIASVWDMAQAIRHIQSFTENLTPEEYFSSVLFISAVERQFEILGEATRRLSNEFRQAHPQINWQQIVGLRSIVIHRYDEVDQERLWAIIHVELPPLLIQLEQLIPPVPDEL
ncbi:HepT-like ribonuclease domain-containing protein [Leptolyngbya sp. NIES-2104]|uniref:HepT-like ribonuclease domain-containing protein n=1 Tax=Leptolyngbya sp. NIES-2104 TaxID=1552121 RepID=UPI00073F2C2A|nr:HepT-like ribonuclease domain-containing protein [Leptolyngbya sp. NIES-2104]